MQNTTLSSARALAARRLPVSTKLAAATTTQSAFLYATDAWPALTRAHLDRHALAYVNPARKAPIGQWAAHARQSPLAQDEALATTLQSKPIAALALARLHWIATAVRGPDVLLAALQTAASCAASAA